MRELYFRDGDAFALVYCITGADTFHETQKIVPEIFKARAAEVGTVPMILVGNKVDLEKHRSVPASAGKEFARENGMEFIETSAKTNTNIREMFGVLLDEIWKLRGFPEKAKAKRGCTLL
jgi:small GTP-binding protein